MDKQGTTQSSNEIYFHLTLREEILKMVSQEEPGKTEARVRALESLPVVQIGAKLFSCFKTDFSASHEYVDFTESQEAADKINSWVSKSTNDVINEVVDASELDDPLTRMILVSAIFFKTGLLFLTIWMRKL